jgi:hypothetical protein
VLIPILTQGGAIPSAIGLGGMLGCCVVAWDASKSRARRLGICAAISAGCWIAFLVFLGVRMLLASRTG